MDSGWKCHILFVPVRTSQLGLVVLRMGRLISGQQVGLAFSSAASLLAALGPCQPWIVLHERAMRDMLEPIGVAQIRIDAR
jgi:hypothetical protein